MTKHEETLVEQLVSIALGARLVLGLLLGSAVMAVGSLYTVAAMAIGRRGPNIGSPRPA